VNISGNLWIWFMGLGMLAIFSFIYKENPLYRLFEHIYVGAGAGYAIGINWGNIYDRGWVPLVEKGQYSVIIPIFLGLMLFTRFFKSVAWVSRWSMSFLVGIGTGTAIYGVVNSQLVAQVRATMINVIAKDTAGAILLPKTLNNIFLVVSVLSILLYFFFSVEQKGPVKTGATLGRWVMMVTFGVSFGNVVMGRISLLLGSLEDILGKWLGIL